MCRCCFGDHIVTISWVKLPFIYIRYYLIAYLLIIWFLQSCYAFIWGFLTPSFRGWVVERSIWGWAPIYQLFSIMENIWISMRVSVCHKKKLLWSATHICGYKDRYLQWRLELGRYRKVIVVVFPLRSMTLSSH